MAHIYNTLRVKLNLDVSGKTRSDIVQLLSCDNPMLNQISMFFRNSTEAQKKHYQEEMLPLIKVGHYKKKTQAASIPKPSATSKDGTASNNRKKSSTKQLSKNKQPSKTKQKPKNKRQ